MNICKLNNNITDNKLWLNQLKTYEHNLYIKCILKYYFEWLTLLFLFNYLFFNVNNKHHKHHKNLSLLKLLLLSLIFAVFFFILDVFVPLMTQLFRFGFG